MKTNFTFLKKTRNLIKLLTLLFFTFMNLAAIAQTLPQNPTNPSSNSPQCSATGVTMNFTGTAPAGETWYWQTSANGTSTINSSPSYTVSASGTYYVRSIDNTSLAWSAGAGQVTVQVNPGVGIPVFVMGSSSTRCMGTATIIYTATAVNNTGIVYSLDAPSTAAGNTINAATGAVTYTSGYIGNSVITASAFGCSGPISAIHTVSVNSSGGIPVFAVGATSTRCQGAGTTVYTAVATGASSIFYSLDSASIVAGITINAANGAVTYLASWTGPSIIKASATGCGGQVSASHVVTILPFTGSPVFNLGASSTRCQGGGTTIYTATATGASTIVYSLDAASIAGGITINAANGAVNYLASWTDHTIITASVSGCGGMVSATHVVTIQPGSGLPVFALGETSTRIQGAGSETYTATATNTTGIKYTLDEASITGGNTIDSTSGEVMYTAEWIGITKITAISSGCSGPMTAVHTVTITPQLNLIAQPNPFSNSLHLFINLRHATLIEFRLLNFNGNTVYLNSIKGVKGINSLYLNELGKLAHGSYLLQVITDEGVSFEKLVKQ